MFNSKRILVVAAHPDDEILGCGASMARFASEGKVVKTLIMAEGLTSRDEKRDSHARSNELIELHQTAITANRMVGAQDPILSQFPDNRMDSADLLDVTKEIERVIEEFRPDLIFTHNKSDVNIDHSIINSAVVTACRSQPGSLVKTVLFFEVQSSTEWQMDLRQVFSPNIWVDCSKYWEKKIAALKIYHSEMRDWPHARSYEAVEALLRWRGSNVGVTHAEAFMLGRSVI